MPMFQDLPYEARVLIWLLLPLTAALVRPRTWPTASTMAFAMAGAALLYGLWSRLAVSPLIATTQSGGQSGGEMITDTYYVLRASPALGFLAGLYAVMGGLCLVVARLSLVPRARLPLLAFWLLHLGVPFCLFPMQAILPFAAMPRRYVDYPETFALWNRVSQLGLLAIWGAVLLMLALTIAAALHRVKAAATGPHR